MTSGAKWTLASIERACRKVFLERGSATLAALSTSSAELWRDGKAIEARVDPLAVGLLAGVLHEVMHDVLAKELAPFQEYGANNKREPAELALIAWESAMVAEILRSRRRRSWWRNAINEKLPRRQRVEK